jgi:4,5-DOPA dioxygenase extradiol
VADILPAIFFGHGNPLNALQTNLFTEGWRKIGERTPKPRAILAVSAHWFGAGTRVTANTAPRTIHDFGGFPRELYQVQYSAPGDPELARRVQSVLAPAPVLLDESWGLDHGTWSVLKHAYPEANIPVVQVSIDEGQPAPYHFELGRRLAPLRAEGVLVIGSGNLVHNLHTYAWGRHVTEPYDWAVRFETEVRRHLMSGDYQPLIEYETLGKDALLAIPTPDHYLPILYVIGARQPDDDVSFPVEGVDGGSISMLCVEVGRRAG